MLHAARRQAPPRTLAATNVPAISWARILARCAAAACRCILAETIILNLLQVGAVWLPPAIAVCVSSAGACRHQHARQGACMCCMCAVRCCAAVCMAQEQARRCEAHHLMRYTATLIITSSPSDTYASRMSCDVGSK